MDRRSLLKWLSATAVTALCPPLSGRGLRAEVEETLPPVRAITRGPKHHWFGYYDKFQFDPTDRYVLGMEVDFEHRSPTPDDLIKIGVIDLKSNDQWTEIGQSRAWSWQQGCMLQWVPGTESTVAWNDREGDRFVCHLLDVKSKQKRTLSSPIYALSPKGDWAITPDFSRLNETRPGYGYAGVPDRRKEVLAPDDAGIWKTDLKSGRTELLLSFAQVAKLPYRKEAPSGVKHWFNHLLVSPDGARFSFLHRWRTSANGFGTRLLTADSDGKNLYILDPHGKTSHYIWRDPERLLAWASHPSHGDKFYLYQDRTDRVEVVGPEVMVVNGHCTYLANPRYILNDTYPDKQRNQHPYVFDVEKGTRHPLGHFHSPPVYNGEWRCDLHPRSSRDGRSVVIDSPHEGNGRQLYLIDISQLVS